MECYEKFQQVVDLLAAIVIENLEKEQENPTPVAIDDDFENAA